MTAGEGWSGFMHNGDPADTPQPDCCTDTAVEGRGVHLRVTAALLLEY